MERTKPRLKTPPGSFFHSSFSRASRKRELMRVAAVISSSVTSRSSRSRFKRSPKLPLAMLCPCRGEWNSDGGLDQSAGSAASLNSRNVEEANAAKWWRGVPWGHYGCGRMKCQTGGLERRVVSVFRQRYPLPEPNPVRRRDGERREFLFHPWCHEASQTCGLSQMQRRWS